MSGIVILKSSSLYWDQAVVMEMGFDHLKRW